MARWACELRSSRFGSALSPRVRNTGHEIVDGGVIPNRVRRQGSGSRWRAGVEACRCAWRTNARSLAARSPLPGPGPVGHTGTGGPGRGQRTAGRGPRCRGVRPPRGRKRRNGSRRPVPGTGSFTRTVVEVFRSPLRRWSPGGTSRGSRSAGARRPGTACTTSGPPRESPHGRPRGGASRSGGPSGAGSTTPVVDTAGASVRTRS